MLLTKSKVDVGDIATIKLVTTEEIIAKVTAIDANTVTIDKPLILQVVAAPNGQPSVQMSPLWVLSTDTTKFELQRSHILVMVLTNEQAKKGYLNNTSSILQPGTTSGLTL